jgi:hypothetical protein
MAEEKREEIAYIYIRGGVEYFTPVEQVAASRTDTGQYTVVYSEQQVQEENKSKDME